MRIIQIVAMCAVLTACFTQPYRPDEIGLYEKNVGSMKFSISLESVRYLPPSGIGPRSVSASGGILLLFKEVPINFDASIEDFSRIEITRALIGFGNTNGNSKSVCLLSADVLLLKQNEILPDETTIRYSLWKSGEQLQSKVMKSQMGSYKGGYDGTMPSQVQSFASGVHRNVYEYLRYPETAELLSRHCAGG